MKTAMKNPLEIQLDRLDRALLVALLVCVYILIFPFVKHLLSAVPPNYFRDFSLK